MVFSFLRHDHVIQPVGSNAFSSYKNFTKLQYDVYGFAKLLIFGRLLNPASKCATVRQNDDYYEPILSDFNPDNVYDTLDFIHNSKDKIIRRMNTNLIKKAGRSPEIIYYDVTNFYYEVEEPDEDILDEDGNVVEKGLRKFFKKECVDKKSDEILDSKDIKPLIDFDKVAESRKSMGYYQIVTSELTMDAQEVFDKYHGLTQIEYQFRVMKGELDTRPLFVRTPEHVEAHLLTYMITLIMLRIIQKRIIQSGLVNIDPDAYWNTGLNGPRIQEALNKWKVDKLPRDLYRFMDTDDPELKLILDAFGIDIPLKLYRRSELKNIKTKIKIFK